MWSTNVINDLSREYGIAARRKNRTPFVPWDAAEVASLGGESKIPNLGDYRPVGWDLVEDLLVDSWGHDPDDADGPALSQNGFKAYMVEHLAESFGYAVIEQGQFQVVVGVFSRNADWTDGSNALGDYLRQNPGEDPR
jgi:hypothetical protein